MGNSTDLLENILSQGPSQGTVHVVLQAMKSQGLTLRVIQECNKALALYPNDIRLRRLLAESYLEAGLIGPAESEVLRLTDELDALSIGYKLQAQILIQQKRLNESSIPLAKYLAIHPNDQEAIDLLAQITPEEPLEELPETAAPESAPAQETESIAKPEQMVDEEYEIQDISPADVEPTTVQPVVPSSEETEALAELTQEVREPLAVEDQEESESGLATPTLAEIYFNQGQTRDAISIYEKILSENPQDEASQARLMELKALAEQKPAVDHDKERRRKKTESTISALESWRAKLREISND